MKSQILLVDDHKILREGLASLLMNQREIDTIHQASDGLQAVNLYRELKPHIVIMDIIMPGMNGIEATRKIIHEDPQAKIICLSAQNNLKLVSAALTAGSSGYLLKGCDFGELFTAIDTVARNQFYLSPGISGVLIETYKAQQSTSPFTAIACLSHREREIMQLLAEGFTTNNIAKRLHLSVKTIGTHREHILSKLKVHSIAEITKIAIIEGLTSLEY